MYPLVVNLAGRLAVVVGGGAVGRRKAAGLLAAGAYVRVVALEPRPGDETSAALEWRQEPFRPEHLDGAALAFAAAPTTVSRAVVVAARRRGVWVNAATEPEQGDFLVPAVLRRGELVVAVSTGGAAPGLAQAVRDWLGEQLDDAVADWVTLVGAIRDDVLAAVPDMARRNALLAHLARREWLERLRRDGVAAVRAAMAEEVRTLLAASPRDPL